MKMYRVFLRQSLREIIAWKAKGITVRVHGVICGNEAHLGALLIAKNWSQRGIYHCEEETYEKVVPQIFEVAELKDERTLENRFMLHSAEHKNFEKL